MQHIIKKGHGLRKISVKLLSFLCCSFGYSSAYAEVWIDDMFSHYHPPADAIEEIHFCNEEDFRREINEYLVLFLEAAPRTVGPLERSVILEDKLERIINELIIRCESSSAFSLAKENVYYYIRDVYVLNRADRRYAIDFKLPEEVLAPFLYLPNGNRFPALYPPLFASILRTRNVFWAEEQDSIIPDLLHSPYQPFVLSLRKNLQAISESPQLLDHNQSEPLDGFHPDKPRDRYRFYARHAQGGEIIRLSDRLGNGRGFTTLTIVPPYPTLNRDGLDGFDFGMLKAIILRTRFWFSDSPEERRIQMTIKPWLKLEGGGSFPHAILRAIQDLQSRNTPVGAPIGAIQVSSQADFATKEQELQVLCNARLQGIMGGVVGPGPLREVFLRCRRRIDHFLSDPKWLRLDVALRDRDYPRLRESLNAIIRDEPNTLNTSLDRAMRIMERHLTRVNERCPHPVTLTPQGGFSLNESNLPHFASIIDFNIIFIRPIERGILHLEIFPREGGRITSLSINPGRSLTPAEHAIIDPLFSESPIQTIILHCDGYGNWYTITHEMIR